MWFEEINFLVVVVDVGDKIGMSFYRRSCLSEVEIFKGIWVYEWQFKEIGTELFIFFSIGSMKKIKQVCVNSFVWDFKIWDLWEEFDSKEEQNEI